MSDDHEPGTGSANYFELGVMNIIDRLKGDPSPDALGMTEEARRLSDVFRAWAEKRPTAHEREMVLRELFRLDRRAEGHVRARPKP